MFLNVPMLAQQHPIQRLTAAVPEIDTVPVVKAVGKDALADAARASIDVPRTGAKSAVPLKTGEADFSTVIEGQRTLFDRPAPPVEPKVEVAQDNGETEDVTAIPQIDKKSDPSPVLGIPRLAEANTPPTLLKAGNRWVEFDERPRTSPSLVERAVSESSRRFAEPLLPQAAPPQPDARALIPSNTPPLPAAPQPVKGAVPLVASAPIAPAPQAEQAAQTQIAPRPLENPRMDGPRPPSGGPEPVPTQAAPASKIASDTPPPADLRPQVLRSVIPIEQPGTIAAPATKDMLQNKRLESRQSDTVTPQVAKPAPTVTHAAPTPAPPVNLVTSTVFDTAKSIDPAVLPVDDLASTAPQTQATQTTQAAQIIPPRTHAPHVAAQIAQAVIQSSGGTTEIALNPEELGRVRISLSNTENGLSVSILAERPETADLMRRNIDSLAREFLDLGHENLSFSFGDDAPHDQPADNATPTQGSFDHEELNSSDPIQTLTAAPLGGLDLKL